MVERLTLGPASVSELARPLAMSLAAVVQHVQVLEACGVVKTGKVGRTRMCRIEPAAMTAAVATAVVSKPVAKKTSSSSMSR